MKSFLILEDGTVFEGNSAGSVREVISEIVFNTSMSGYLEVLTDPSYKNQAVVFTYPLLGNYGVCHEDMGTPKVWPDGIILKNLSRISSNFRSEDTLTHFLEEHDVPAITDVDTRALTKVLREKGTMKGMITTNADYDLSEVVSRLKAYKITITPGETGTQEVITIPGSGKKIAMLDLGARNGLEECFHKRDAEVTIYPALTKAEDIIKTNPDGIVLTNGAGNPEDYRALIPEIKKLMDSGIPMFGMSLGHQLIAMAAGAEVIRLTHGHHGGNYPVRDLETGRVYITAQNHDYAVNADTVRADVAVPYFVNVNDNTNAGLRYEDKKIMTVQFHPEVFPGPAETGYIIDRYMEMTEEEK